jgi:hypothetical protein
MSFNIFPLCSVNKALTLQIGHFIGYRSHVAESSRISIYLPLIGHEGFVGLSVSKVHISATRWRLFTLTAVALRFCRATEETPSIGGNKRWATARSLNDLP